MYKNIERLSLIAAKDTRLIMGLMSGTSLDGLDVALCRFTGNGPGCKMEILEFETVSYEDSFKKEIRSVFSKQTVDLEKLCLLNAWVGTQHGAMIIQCLQKWGMAGKDIDLVASHGQTIYHAPKSLHQQDKFSNATLQIGDGDHIAVSTGIITISDFRQKHIAAGGEGAPLAVYGDYLLFSKKGENRIMLNIGGIANFTCLPGDLNATAVFSTDTGPGNTLMDACMQQNFQMSYDKDSAIAKKGAVNPLLLAALCEHSFFEKVFPKTTGPELFNLSYLESAMQRANIHALSQYDVMATLNRFSAETIANAIQKIVPEEKSFSIYTSGGGMHNSLLMQNLQQLLPNYSFYTTDELRVNPDAKEALLFAVLANECVAGDSLSMGKSTQDIPSVSMGKISFPS